MTWGLLVFCTVYGVVVCIASALVCLPTPYFWDRSVPGGHCVNLMAYWMANSGVAIFTDIAICVLPIPILQTLRIPKRQKYSLILVFFLGGFGCITALLRLQSIKVIGQSNDPTFYNAAAAMWSSIEINTCIMCGCLPTFRPLINRAFPRLLRGSQERWNGNSIGYDEDGDHGQGHRARRLDWKKMTFSSCKTTTTAATVTTTQLSEADMQFCTVPEGMFESEGVAEKEKPGPGQV